MALTTISPHDAQELIARGAKLIDIRDADEYLREHIPEADLAPLSVLEQSGLPAKLRHEQIIFHCQAGKRTSNNADKLAAIAAPAEIFLLEDGIDGWKRAGLPVAVNKSQPLPFNGVESHTGVSLSASVSSTLVVAIFSGCQPRLS